MIFDLAVGALAVSVNLATAYVGWRIFRWLVRVAGTATMAGAILALAALALRR